MIDFFRGMAAGDVFICCVSMLIVVSAIAIMLHDYICNYILERSHKEWQNEQDYTMR